MEFLYFIDKGGGARFALSNSSHGIREVKGLDGEIQPIAIKIWS